MRKKLIRLSHVIFIFAGILITPFPENFANAQRSISPYCLGTSPIRRVWVEVREKTFAPDSIEVKKNDCIELTALATGGVNHNLRIDKSSITSEGAPLINRAGKHIGRAMYRKSSTCDNCVPMNEGWFSEGDAVLLRFQVNKAGTYHLRCRNEMALTIAVSP